VKLILTEIAGDADDPFLCDRWFFISRSFNYVVYDLSDGTLRKAGISEEKE